MSVIDACLFPTPKLLSILESSSILRFRLVIPSENELAHKSEFLYERGILVCSTGIGMCMAANKVKGIRAAPCYDTFGARRARQHNDANVLCLGAEKRKRVSEIVNTFLTNEFEGERHQRRVDKIRDLEG